MGFREKNAWFCFVAIFVVFAPYFYFSLQYPVEHVSVFFIAVIGLVILLSVFHAINAIATKSIRESRDAPQADELDAVIELRASKGSGVILMALVLIWCLVAMWSVPVEAVSNTVIQQEGSASPDELGFAITSAEALLWINLLFAGFVVSNLTYYGKMIASYRGLSNG
ncbi:MAG: hypothetical protein P8L78_13100 [Mariniblastus sp.]|nr:hypothetical protein [Mariniblastus sp.]